MYISEDLQKELDFFKRTNNEFEIEAGKSTSIVNNATNEMLYMAMSASLVMDCSEDAFFENFIIVDKSISGKNELLIDAYALIETESSKVKQLHIFQYKLHDTPNKSASPIDLLNFSTSVNNNFVHPEFLAKPSNNEVITEIKKKCDSFLNQRGKTITVYCHFINNAKGVYNDNQKEIENVIGRFTQDKQIFGFSIQVYGIKEILDLAKEGKIQVADESLEIESYGQNSYRLEDNSNKGGIGLPKKVLIGMCNVNEFIRLQNKYHHNQLYSENIRLYLGDRGNVNKDIISTITSTESIWFPYMNNGISIICDKMSIGSHIETKNTRRITLNNMQIINGCQTVNALYNAKYGENTKDNFRPANVMVRVYEIDPKLTEFKINIIKATNNQNSVKSYSLVANDPIQIAISNIFKRFNIVYDRKGEGKDANKNQQIISMVTVALAYRSVYLFMAKSLRSGLGTSRVFQKSEYERVFDSSLLEDVKRLEKRCFEFIIANGILNNVRSLIQVENTKYIERLPIFKKSAYYLAGFMYAYKKEEFDKILNDIITVYETNNDKMLVGKDFPKKIDEIVKNYFSETVDRYISFYEKTKDVDKTDIDNLLKSKNFGINYHKEIEEMGCTIPNSNLDNLE